MKFQALVLSSILAVSFGFQPTAKSSPRVASIGLCMRSDPSDDGGGMPFIDGAKQCMAAASLSAALAFGTLTGLPAPSVADTTTSTAAFASSAIDPTRTIQVELNAPTLIKRLKSPTYQKELLDALSEVQDVLGKDSIQVTPPSNKVGALRDLLSGKVDVSLNGQALDIEVLDSEKGEITVRFSNPLLPKVPVVSSKAKIPFLPEVEGQGTVQIVRSEQAAAKPDLGTILDAAWLVFGPEDSGDIDLLGLLARTYGIDTSKPLQDQPFMGGILSIPIPRANDKGGQFTYVASNKDVIAGGSLGLGAIYAVSYSYHTSLIEQEEREAEEKKKALDEKKKRKEAAAATKTKVESTDAEAAKAESKVSKPKVEKKVAENTKAMTVVKTKKPTKEATKKEEPSQEEDPKKKQSKLRRLFSRKKD